MDNHQRFPQENFDAEEGGNERNYFSDEERKLMNTMGLEDLCHAYGLWNIGIEGVDEEDVARAREEIRNVVMNRVSGIVDMVTRRESPEKGKAERLPQENIAEVIRLPIKPGSEPRLAKTIKKPSRPNLRLIK